MTESVRPSGFEFPCSFPLKVIGLAGDDFEAFAVSLVRKHVSNVDPAAVTSRPSRGGKYLAVTVTFVAESRPQLDALYLEISQTKRILMAL
jgi:putative lipoic acid-binding regulatory protein